MSAPSDDPGASGNPLAWSPPYPPSWVDRLVRRIDALPSSGWWVYPILLVLEIVYVQIARWAFGSMPVGSFDPWVIPLLLYGPYTLAMLQYLDRVADGAFATFRPALGVDDAEAQALRYELITLPARGVWVAVVVGLLLGAGTLLFGPATLLEKLGTTPFEILAVGGPQVAFGYGMTAVFIYHTYRQLRLVSRTHREARRLDLYDDAPLFAFSRLTARTGLAYLAVAYFTLTVNAGSLAGDPVSLGTSVTAICVGIACFLVPLLGIHGRLVLEKAQLMRAANRRLHVATDELYGRIDSGELTGIGDVNNAVSGLTTIREQISRLPTWPWPPQVLRGFITALLLPVVIWFVTHQLGQVVR